MPERWNVKSVFIETADGESLGGLSCSLIFCRGPIWRGFRLPVVRQLGTSVVARNLLLHPGSDESAVAKIDPVEMIMPSVPGFSCSGGSRVKSEGLWSSLEVLWRESSHSNIGSPLPVNKYCYGERQSHQRLPGSCADRTD